MIVLDASVLIAQLDAADAHHGRATDLLRDAAEEALAVSQLTLVEVLVVPARSGQLDVAQLAVETLGIGSIPLPADAPRRVAALCAETRLRLPDCCVLLAAQSAGASLATFDDHLANAAGQLGIDVRS